MILVTGGLGFIGQHTVRSLLDLGESCVLVQRRTPELPAGLRGENVVVEQADINDLEALRDIGKRHEIRSIVHLAFSMPWPPTSDEPIEASRTALGSLFNILQVAREWGVTRVGLASTIGVYSGLAVDGPLTEDVALPMTSFHVIPTFKKIGELLGDHLADATGLDIVNYRISGIWGPGGHEDDLFFPAAQLVHAAVRGAKPNLPQPRYAEDALDLCYVKDCGRAIAALQIADRLNHRTYNVASGRATSNAEVIAAIKKIIPDAQVDLPRTEPGPRSYLDITRIHQDTGYQPAYDTESAVADYIDWLRSAS